MASFIGRRFWSNAAKKPERKIPKAFNHSVQDCKRGIHPIVVGVSSGKI
jgi:hypothetical protein